MSTPKQYMIIWNYGFGDNSDVVEAETQEEAALLAYEEWREGAQNNAEYRAEELTVDLLLDHGFTPEDYGFDPEEDDE